MTSPLNKLWRAMLSILSRPADCGILVLCISRLGYPYRRNPYREIYDKMRVRVGVRTAVAKDICSFYGEALEGDRRVGVRCQSFTAWSDDVFLRQLWRAMLSCLSRPADGDGRVSRRRLVIWNGRCT